MILWVVLSLIRWTHPAIKKLAPPTPPAKNGEIRPVAARSLPLSSLGRLLPLHHISTHTHIHTHQIAHHDSHLHRWQESTHPAALPTPDAGVGGSTGSTSGSTNPAKRGRGPRWPDLALAPSSALARVDEVEVVVGLRRSRGHVRHAPPGSGGCPFCLAGWTFSPGGSRSARGWRWAVAAWRGDGGASVAAASLLPGTNT
jgi:hypothetical protein